MAKGKKKINECEDVNINFPHWNTKRKNNRWGKKQNLQELWNDFKSCSICIIRIPKVKEREKKKYWSNNGEEFSKTDGWHQTTDPGSQIIIDNTKQDKDQNIYI